MDVDNEDPAKPSFPSQPTNQADPLNTSSSTRVDENNKLQNHQNVSLILKAAADRALVFFSTASNEKVGASLVALGAVTYAILGRLGLVLIGGVCGVVLHATWEANNVGGKSDEDKGAELNRRREIGLDVVHRVMAWREKKSLPDDNGLDEAGSSSPTASSDFSDFRPETAEALNAFADAAIRDYVKWWYSPILPSDIAFPTACKKTLASFIRSLSTHMYRKRPVDTFLDFTTNSCSIIVVLLNELSSALSASPQASAEDAIHAYLSMKPQCNLASIMDERHQQRKLLMVADDILESFLDQHVYRCSPARVFLREILSNVVLEMTIQKCCKSEWINDWIVYLLEDGEPELLNVIDAGVGGSAAQQGLGLQQPTANGAAVSALPKSTTEDAQSKHKRNVSRAEEAMEEAMREAKRLTEMIAEEDARRVQEQESSNASNADDMSESNTHGVQTPTSSQSDPNGEADPGHSDITSPSTDRGSQEGQEPESISNSATFTDFDQVVPNPTPTALRNSSFESSPRQRETLTLHKANLSIMDDGGPIDKRALRAKPNIDYLIQIEPASSNFSGWMIPRTYADFEDLHEILRRISAIGGVPFIESHANLPAWKGSTKSGLRDELERYLTDAVHFEQLAESEGMKRFLDKDRGLTRSPGKPGLWPNQAFENVGKGVVDVFTKAPKGVAEGGKAVIGGVTSVFGGVASAATKKPVVAPSPTPPALSRQSTSSLADSKRMSANLSGTDLRRQSQDVPRRESPQSSQARPSMDERSSSYQYRSKDQKAKLSSSSNLMLSSEDSAEQVSTTSGNVVFPRQPASLEMNLPPLPAEIPDDYAMPAKSVRPKVELPAHTSHMSVDGTSFFDVPTPPVMTPARSPINGPIKEEPSVQIPKRPKRTNPKQNRQPFTEPEAQVTVELMFAVINELYTLSSAWNIRRTLLGAAKTFLLRPGNPQLENIRTLLQESLLDANISDSGIAAHVLKLRENSLPTEEELAKWPAPPNEVEKEALRKRARKMLMERGMPQALTSVMGASASAEALGKIFDCLQVEEVARGLMFGLMLQSIRAVTQ